MAQSPRRWPAAMGTRRRTDDQGYRITPPDLVGRPPASRPRSPVCCARGLPGSRLTAFVSSVRSLHQAYRRCAVRCATSRAPGDPGAPMKRACPGMVATRAWTEPPLAESSVTRCGCGARLGRLDRPRVDPGCGSHPEVARSCRRRCVASAQADDLGRSRCPDTHSHFDGAADGALVTLQAMGPRPRPPGASRARVVSPGGQLRRRGGCCALVASFLVRGLLRRPSRARRISPRRYR
jgi:hypothetical protein